MFAKVKETPEIPYEEVFDTDENASDDIPGDDEPPF